VRVFVNPRAHRRVTSSEVPALERVRVDKGTTFEGVLSFKSFKFVSASRGRWSAENASTVAARAQNANGCGVM